jgi:hypothetical protein
VYPPNCQDYFRAGVASFIQKLTEQLVNSFLGAARSFAPDEIVCCVGDRCLPALLGAHNPMD